MYGFTLWFTGPPGSGKSILANHIASILREPGNRVEVLENRGWGVRGNHRNLDAKLMGWAAELLNRNGVAVIATETPSPVKERQHCREQISNVVEVFVNSPPEMHEEQIHESALVERPGHRGVLDDSAARSFNPKVMINTTHEGIDQSTQKILKMINDLGYLSYRANGNVVTSIQ